MANNAKVDFSKIIPFEITNEKDFAKAYQYLSAWYAITEIGKVGKGAIICAPNQYTGSSVLSLGRPVSKWFSSAIQILNQEKLSCFDFIDYVVRKSRKEGDYKKDRLTIQKYFDSNLRSYIDGFKLELQQKKHLDEVKNAINSTIKYIILETLHTGHRRTWDWFKNEILLKKKLGRMVMSGKISIYFLPFIHNFNQILDKVYREKEKNEDYQFLNIVYLSKAAIIAVDTKATFPMMKKKFSNIFDFCDETMKKATVNQNKP